MLNPNAQKWVAALRSKEFVRGKHTLCCENKYCCLGVACELYLQENPTGLEVTPDIGDGKEYDGEPLVLPRIVKKWLNLQTSNGEFDKMISFETEMGHIGKTNQLTILNDMSCWNFESIADFIESEPKGLFL